MRLAGRVGAVPVASTSRMRTLAQELRDSGRPVVNLAAGELEQPPPDAVVDALVAAARAGHNRYTDTAGAPELRQGLARRFAAATSVTVSADQVVVTTGAKHALYLAALVLFEPGDEVLVPTPSWVTFPAQVTLAGARPVPVDTTASGFHLTADLLARHRTARTRAVIINTPNNPTGAVYAHDEVAGIARWARENGVFVVFDESYAALTFAGHRHWHPLRLLPEAADLVVTVSSFSKTFAVAGWRAGFAVGPRPVMAAMKKLQAHTTSNATSVVQAAMARGLEADLDGYAKASAASLGRRWMLVDSVLSSVPDVAVVSPQGGFFALLDCRRLLGRRAPGGGVVANSDDLAEYLLAHAGVATVPGQAFGAEGHVRISFAGADAEVEEGVTRLAKAFAELDGD